MSNTPKIMHYNNVDLVELDQAVNRFSQYFRSNHVVSGEFSHT